MSRKSDYSIQDSSPAPDHDDNLYGGTGNDTYQFNRGDGDDVLFDEAGAIDVLSLGPNITESDLSLDVLGNDLIVRVLDNGLLTTDQITLSDWFNVDNRI